MSVLTALIAPLLLAATASAAPFEKRGLAQVVSQCKHDFAYTWDDGPYQWTSTISNKFTSRKAKTTYFMNGNNWSCIYDQANVDSIRHAYEQGHEIATHTWSHPHVTELTEAQIDEQIQRLDEAFIKILGVKPNIFRPPFGDIDERTATYIQQKHGKTIVTWDSDSQDGFGVNTVKNNVDFYNDLISKGISLPHMSLSHEVWENSAIAAQQATVDNLVNAGFKLVTVAECLDVQPYTSITGKYGVRDATWTCAGTWTPSPPQQPEQPEEPEQPPQPTCKQTYTTVTGDTCATIDSKFNLVTGTTLGANSFLNCSDIWANTPVCIPDGPYKPTTPPPTGGEPSCVTQTYTAVTGDTCAKIEAAFALKDGSVQASNSFVNCSDIWANTPLSICVPTLGSNDSPTCTRSVTASSLTTCAAIGAANGVSAAWIKAYNPFVNCSDIWSGTSICVAH